MAISKIILNGEVQMDVTSDTVTAGSMLSGTTATKNDGTKATGTIASKSSSDLTASGATVTAPAGYYSASASKSVTTMTLPTTTSTSATSGYTLKATLDRSTSDRYLNIAPGYNSAGGYYKINKVANGLVTAPSSISGTSATVSTGTNTLTFTKSVSVTPNVTTAGYISSGTAGNSSVSLTASVTTKGAATITPSTSEQSIAAGTYLTGKQTISAMPSGTAGTPTASKGSVSNNSISVTPSVTNTTGYITGGTKTGTAVTVSASELVSGTKSITENGTGVDVTNYASVDVAVTTNVAPLTVTPSDEVQTFYSDGNAIIALRTGDYASSVGAVSTSLSFANDYSAVKENVPYEISGSLTVTRQSTSESCSIILDGISIRSSDSTMYNIAPFPFTYTGADLVSKVRFHGTGSIVIYLKSSMEAIATVTSDIIAKEVGNRTSQFNYVSSTNYTNNTAIAIDSSGLSVGDTCSISGLVRASTGAQSGGEIYSESFDEHFTWDGNTHTFTIASAGTLTVTPSSVSYSTLQTARRLHFSFDLSKYERLDGYNPITVEAIPSSGASWIPVRMKADSSYAQSYCCVCASTAAGLSYYRNRSLTTSEADYYLPEAPGYPGWGILCCTSGSLKYWPSLSATSGNCYLINSSPSGTTTYIASWRIKSGSVITLETTDVS